MKTVKLKICLLAIFLFCTSLTACAGKSNEQPEQDAVQVEAEQKEKDGYADEQADGDRELYDYEEYVEKEGEDLLSDDVDNDGQAENEEELYESEEEAENEYQGQEIGSYEHHIGDVVFYTEHDLQKYISPNPMNPIHNQIDIEAMLVDAWGPEDAIKPASSNGYIWYNGSPSPYAVFSYFDVDDDIANKRMVVSSWFDDDHGEYRSVITSWNTSKPDGGYLIVKDDSRGYGFTPEMAAIFLYVLEQTKSNPRGNVAGELGLSSNYECTY